MKNAPLILAALLVIATVAWAISAKRSGLSKTVPPPLSASSAGITFPKPVPPHSPPPPLLLSGEWRQYRDVREATLKSNPELAVEYKELMQEMDNQQAKLEAAMIKVDPKSAPVVAKLDMIRKHNSIPPIGSSVK